MPGIKKRIKALGKPCLTKKDVLQEEHFFASLFHLCLSLFFSHLCFSFKVKQTWLVLCMAEYDTDSESPNVSEPCFLEIKYAPVICCTDMIPQGSYPKTMRK